MSYILGNVRALSYFAGWIHCTPQILYPFLEKGAEIVIEVRLFATFREGRNKIEMMQSEDIQCVSDLLNILDIPEEEVAICLVNGFHSKPDTHVNEGDVIALFPPVGGG